MEGLFAAGDAGRRNGGHGAGNRWRCWRSCGDPRAQHLPDAEELFEGVVR